MICGELEKWLMVEEMINIWSGDQLWYDNNMSSREVQFPNCMEEMQRLTWIIVLWQQYELRFSEATNFSKGGG